SGRRNAASPPLSAVPPDASSRARPSRTGSRPSPSSPPPTQTGSTPTCEHPAYTDQLTPPYGIVHDKDHREVWSAVEQQLVTELKPDHVHAVIKFASRAKSAPLDRLATAIGVEPQYVEKPGRGRYAYDNMISYLTHAKYADKHQYDP